MRSYKAVLALRDAGVLAAPMIVAAVLCYQICLHDQHNRAQIMADMVLDRSEVTTQQLANAFVRLEAFDASQACSANAVALMREVDLGSSLLQGFGYVRDNQLLCSSLGEVEAVDLGPPDYVSRTGAIIRRQRQLPMAPETPLLLVTGASGYTGIVHPALIFSLSAEGMEQESGTVSFTSRQTILYSGPRTFDWAHVDMPADQNAGIVVIDDQILAWRRSGTWDQFAYSATPVAAVTEEFWGSIGLFLAMGTITGITALLLWRRFAANRTSLPTLLKVGLSRGEVHTVYQPIVDMRTGAWVGAEVLARWKRASGEWISPDVFVPIAEKHGLIRQLTRHVMTSSAEDLKAFVNFAPDFFVSVNITSMDLQDPEFVTQLLAECAARNIAHHRVHLEITERAEVDPTREAQTIKGLREMGFAIGIDDFGIGYSNLAYLDTLHLDYLKIDKAFIAGITNGSIGTAVIDHIIELGNERNLTIIAEGVEEESQRAELVARGVWLGQGWLFARPMSAAQLFAGYTAKAPTDPVEWRLAEIA